MEKASSRLRVLAIFVALMFVALTTRLWSLQVLASDDFGREARKNEVRFVRTEPLRGQIYDTNGEVMVGNRPSLEVRVNREKLGDQAEGVVLRLSDVLSVPVSELRADLQDERFYRFQPIPVAEFVDDEVAFYLEEHADEFPGVDVVKVSVRDYPMGRVAAHTLGYVGLISADEYDQLKPKYGQSDVIGRAGLESMYERFLRGSKGTQKYVVNADGETIRALEAVEPTAGNDLHLSIDADIQRAAEEQLRVGLQRARLLHDSEGRSLRANAGSIVVLDAKTGHVKALASVPSYDPRWYVEGLSKAQTSYLENELLGPSLNRAIQLGYAPGSTFKPVSGLVAVKEGVASLNGYYPCTTEYVHPGDESGAVFNNWAPWNSHMTFAEALRVSCDTVFYGWGSDFFFRYLNNQLGAAGQPLQKGLREWGFDEPLGIDLPSEAGGVIADARWAEEDPTGQQLFPDGWIPGGDILSMIGSSYVTATPLQMAAAYGAIANGGKLCQPHVVDRIESAEGKVVRDFSPKCRALPYTTQQMQYVRNALASVVTSGTARCAFTGFPLSQVPVAGKTGTAERGSPEFQDTSWFAAIVGPTGDPGYVVVVMVEQGGFGSQTAAPITRALIEQIEGLGDTPRPGCGSEVDG